ncbi:hypothetical protein [Mesorhizobium sp. M0088]|uniref:hypothetical protein n=1 Tax=Mesorhizobium sp. M0088 TaxID=2956873 RepID=UPI00333A4382
MKLTEAQREAWEWTYERGFRSWHGTLAGDPSMAALTGLVNKGFLTKYGGNGWPSCFERSEAGRSALSQNNRGTE